MLIVSIVFRLVVLVFNFAHVDCQVQILCLVHASLQTRLRGLEAISFSVIGSDFFISVSYIGNSCRFSSSQPVPHWQSLAVGLWRHLHFFGLPACLWFGRTEDWFPKRPSPWRILRVQALSTLSRSRKELFLKFCSTRRSSWGFQKWRLPSQWGLFGLTGSPQISNYAAHSQVEGM